MPLYNPSRNGIQYAGASQVNSVSSTAGIIFGSSPTPTVITVTNNSATAGVWVRLSGTPEADSGGYPPTAGDAIGELIPPGGAHTTPVPIADTPVSAVSDDMAQVTVTYYSLTS